MTDSNLVRVRRTIGDKLRVQRKEAIGDGVSKFYKMDHEPVQDMSIWIDDVLTVAYTLDADQGMVEFVGVPAINVKIVFQYYASVWTDAEITDQLEMYDDNVNITSASILWAWAADVARLAKRETLSGGGGLGAVTKDTSVAARELRNTAKELLDWEKEYGEVAGTAIPAEGLTEIPWTEASYFDGVYQRIIRDS